MKKKKLTSFIMAAMMFTSIMAVRPVSGETNVYVNPAAQYQTFNGWGTSLAWWTDVVGDWSQQNKTSVMDALYDVNKGLGMNIARYNIGGGENPDHNHMRTGGAVPGFQPERGVWDWNADAKQRDILLMAKDKGADVFEAFSNSPPHWMTYSGCTAGNGLKPIFGKNNLKDEEYSNFADYLTEVVKYYSDNYGITFDSLSPINEPVSPAWVYENGQEGCHWDRDKQNLIMKEVGKKLEEKGLSTILSGPEENSINENLDSYNSYDSTAKNYISRVNAHSYTGNKRYEVKEMAAMDNKDLWMSEYGCGGDWREPISSHDHYAMKWPLRLAETITYDINDMGSAAWVYWQAIESEEGTIEGNNSWGLIHASYTPGQEEIYYTNQYYAMSNFSKFIRPGATIINSGDDNIVAAYDKNTNELILVVTNAKTSEQNFNFNLLAFDSLGSTANVYRTSVNEALQQLDDIQVSNDSLNITAKAESVTTYRISNVDYSGKKSINDTLIGNQQEKFRYTGNWNYSYLRESFSKDVHWSETADNYFETTFNGTQFELYGEKNTYFGIAGISIDGGPEIKVNCYSPSQKTNTLLFTSPILSDGTHTVKVRVTGEKDPNSTSIVVSADRLDVYSAGQEVPVNLALGKKTSSDSEQGWKKNYASNAVDGAIGTQWVANDGYWTHWLQVDLGDVYKLTSTEVNRDSGNKVYKYYIETSVDGNSWTTVVDKRNNTSSDNAQLDEFSETEGRYVRINFTEVGGWVSLQEFKVFGD